MVAGRRQRGFGALGIALGGYLYHEHDITLVLDG